MLIYSSEQVGELCRKTAQFDNLSQESIREHCVVRSALWFKNDYLKLHFRTTREYLKTRPLYPTIAIDEVSGDVWASMSGVASIAPTNYVSAMDYYYRG